MTLTERQNLICEISDNYKSLNGFRPRWNFSAWTTEQLREEAADLQRLIERDIREEQEAAEREAAALVPAPAFTIGDVVDLGDLDDRMYPGEENTPWYRA